MPRIRCHYIDCVYLEEGYCGTNGVEVDPDEGCMTYSRFDELGESEEWDEDELEGLLEDEDELYEDDYEDDWLEEDNL